MLIKYIWDWIMDADDLEKLVIVDRPTEKELSVVPKRKCRIHRKNHNCSNHSRKVERVITKNCQFNLEKWHKSKCHGFPDIVTMFVEARWRWTLGYCIITYVFIWLNFAAIFWFILYLHDDFEPDNIATENSSNSTGWVPCVRQIYGFTSIFLFSIEIHTTIGYGTRSLTLECPAAIFTMCLESILGTIVQSFIVGIVFAKLTRPKNRAQTLMFSKCAVINLRDRHLRLIFRVGNTRKSRIVAAKVHAFLIKHITHGDVTQSEQIKLDLSMDATDDLFFLFPISAVHTINENSPFYELSALDLLKSRIEVLVLFEGTIESTGQPVQAKSSYTAHEILWEHRYSQMVDYRKNKKGYVIDYSKFDETYSVATPLCSAHELDHLYDEVIGLNFKDTFL